MKDAAKYAPLEWVDWFNNRRLFELIGNIPPKKQERWSIIHLRIQTKIAFDKLGVICICTQEGILAKIDTLSLLNTTNINTLALT